jgi:transcriptional regulator with XRE-family HTH domain
LPKGVNNMRILIDSRYLNVIGPNVKAARIANHITQEQLSIKLEKYSIFINRTAISKIERQQRIITDIELIAFSKALELSINLLLGVSV